MNKWVSVTGALLLLAILACTLLWYIANARYRGLMAEADAAWTDIAGRTTAKPERYHPDMVKDLPDVAKAYFNHAIAEGALLYRHVDLTMAGDFLLGEKGAQQTYAMQARQLLAAPGEFVWNVNMSKGPFRISGSDGFWNQDAWTRFWMFRSIPLVQQAATTDLNRSAVARPAIESIWAPATLLPANGATWVQIAPDTAEVTFAGEPEPITITLRIAENGALMEIWTRRWSNENPAKTFQFQPFGGTIEAEDTFDGFTIPSRVIVGNHFGTAQYLPFFKTNVTGATYF